MSSDSQADDPARTASIEDCLAIGSVLNSNSHIDYTVEIYNERDREYPPETHDWGFGQPVFIHKEVDGSEYAIMGVVYDTQLVDPDQGRSGPRLAQADQPQFTPGYVEERTTLAGVALLGAVPVGEGGDLGRPDQTMPRWTLDVDDQVLLCPAEMTAAFHTDEEGALQLAYVDRLVDVAGPLGAEVTVAILERLRDCFGADSKKGRVLDVIERNVEWQASSDRGVVR
mgnify:CR=1 FL=1